MFCLYKRSAYARSLIAALALMLGTTAAVCGVFTVQAASPGNEGSNLCPGTYVKAMGGYVPIPRRFVAKIPNASEPRVLWFVSPPFLELRPDLSIPNGHIRIGPYSSHWSAGGAGKEADGFTLVEQKSVDGIQVEQWELTRPAVEELRGKRLVVLQNGKEFVEIYDQDASLPQALLTAFLSLRRQIKQNQVDEEIKKCVR